MTTKPNPIHTWWKSSSKSQRSALGAALFGLLSVVNPGAAVLVNDTIKSVIAITAQTHTAVPKIQAPIVSTPTSPSSADG